MAEGYVKLYRKVQDNWVWTSPDRYCRRAAWIDLMMEARWKPGGTVADLGGGHLVSVKRGQVIYSLDTWTKRWHWSKQEVRTFLKQLEKHGMIKKENVRKSTRITLCNYEPYQDAQHGLNTDLTHAPHAPHTELTSTEEGKNGNTERRGEVRAAWDRFREVNPACATVAEQSFFASVAAYRTDKNKAAMVSALNEALDAFTRHCADIVSFKPQTPLQKFENYLRVALEKIEKKLPAGDERPLAKSLGNF